MICLQLVWGADFRNWIVKHAKIHRNFDHTGNHRFSVILRPATICLKFGTPQMNLDNKSWLHCAKSYPWEITCRFCVATGLNHLSVIQKSLQNSHPFPNMRTKYFEMSEIRRTT